MKGSLKYCLINRPWLTVLQSPAKISFESKDLFQGFALVILDSIPTKNSLFFQVLQSFSSFFGNPIWPPDTFSQTSPPLEPFHLSMSPSIKTFYSLSSCQLSP